MKGIVKQINKFKTNQISIVDKKLRTEVEAAHRFIKQTTPSKE